MEDLKLMCDVMQSSLDKDHNWDFDSDVSDVSKVLNWLEEFNDMKKDKVKFLNQWNR